MEDTRLSPGHDPVLASERFYCSSSLALPDEHSTHSGCPTRPIPLKGSLVSHLRVSRPIHSLTQVLTKQPNNLRRTPNRILKPAQKSHQLHTHISPYQYENPNSPSPSMPISMTHHPSSHALNLNPRPRFPRRPQPNLHAHDLKLPLPVQQLWTPRLAPLQYLPRNPLVGLRVSLPASFRHPGHWHRNRHRGQDLPRPAKHRRPAARPGEDVRREGERGAGTRAGAGAEAGFGSRRGRRRRIRDRGHPLRLPLHQHRLSADRVHRRIGHQMGGGDAGCVDEGGDAAFAVSVSCTSC